MKDQTISHELMRDNKGKHLGWLGLDARATTRVILVAKEKERIPSFVQNTLLVTVPA
jgi:hypothetical protein